MICLFGSREDWARKTVLDEILSLSLWDSSGDSKLYPA